MTACCSAVTPAPSTKVAGASTGRGVGAVVEGVKAAAQAEPASGRERPRSPWRPCPARLSSLCRDLARSEACPRRLPLRGHRCPAHRQGRRCRQRRRVCRSPLPWIASARAPPRSVSFRAVPLMVAAQTEPAVRDSTAQESTPIQAARLVTSAATLHCATGGAGASGADKRDRLDRERREADDSGQRCGPVLPSGTVTFLFTDVEGSTRLLEEIGDEAYEEALSVHRRIVRATSRTPNAAENEKART